jgi:hypothetical protein
VALRPAPLPATATDPPQQRWRKWYRALVCRREDGGGDGDGDAPGKRASGAVPPRSPSAARPPTGLVRHWQRVEARGVWEGWGARVHTETISLVPRR